MKITPYPSESAARTAIDRRKIDGALVGGPTGATLIVVPAASAAGATALSTAFGAAAAALHQKLAVVQAHPLPRREAVTVRAERVLVGWSPTKPVNSARAS